MARQKNKEDMYRLIGSSNHTGEARGEEDFYASDPASIDGLLEKETFSKHIWEPACGMGHLSDKLKNLGYDVRESDLVLRKEGAEQKDFLFFNEDRFGGDIITNPPYALAQEFVEQSLKCVGEGHKVAMLLRLLFLESIERRRLFDIAPPFVFTSIQSAYGATRTARLRTEAAHCATHGLSGRKGIKAQQQ